MVNLYKSKLNKVIEEFRKEESYALSRRDGDPYVSKIDNIIDLSYLFLRVKVNDFTDELLDLIKQKGLMLSEFNSEQLKGFDVKKKKEETKVVYNKKNVPFTWSLDKKNKSLTYNRGNEYINYVKKTNDSFYTFESFNINLVVSLALEYKYSGLMAMKIANILKMEVEDLFLSLYRVNIINEELFLEFKNEEIESFLLKVEDEYLILWSCNDKIINKIFNPNTHDFKKILKIIGE